VNNGSAAMGLPVVYQIVTAQEWLCLQPLDKPLLVLLGSFLLPVLISLVLGVWIRALQPGQAWAMVAWLERCWIAVLLLLSTWAGILRQRDVLDPGDSPIATHFATAFWTCVGFVVVVTAVLMLRFRGTGRARLGELLLAEGLFVLFSGVLWLLQIPHGIERWWCP
jgi:hypothetical protein